ncbi:hypothetical protein VN12_26480 [Pirellula sp. SH-Sr6A]|uniref:hypothetical protein n=1 Tax=Pirellula sp. SH-Sr6A TaxID=1632865 RepID=UPI00078DFADE|nr:hypothetical protein [Pirellula sp. SH-Sr6A]AMV35667.1 hypothetical protein VN12_26480 [Pirellula sp. SH-Sr6A]
MPIMSSSHHALPILRSFTLSLLPAIATMTIGCNRSAVETSSRADCAYAGTIQSANTFDSKILYDLGVVFAGETSYVAIPTEKLKIADSAIASVWSSCECAVPSVVKYQASANLQKEAIRIDFVTKPASAGERRISSLAVELSIRLSDSTIRIVEIQFLLSFRPELKA